jgi:DNA-binding NtrC family response regulator
VASLRNAYNLARSAREVKQLKEIKRELASEQPMFWGESPAMARIREIVEKVAATDANILITGENGTGKEMLAREIHNRSARSGELMVSVDMGAVPETLFESELFGHVKGAFTDARADRAGKFEVADHGTLFLDEIGNLPPHLQSKLLTAIQGGRIFRVGSNTPVAVDIRLICATNRDLFGMVARGGEFREDLLYRINTIHIDLPPLRQRREDILPLAEMFLKRYATKYNKPIEGFDQAAVREMDEYPWAGNIRELQHTVEKAVIMSDGRRITPATLLLRPAPAAVQALAFSTLEEMERGMIGQAMARYAGNLTEVARQLGITRQTLYNKIKRYGL